MDEPTSSLTSGEISFLMKIMRALKNEGVSILFITHKLEEIIEITDRITVLRDGRLIETLNTKDATINQMVSLMVGRDFEKIVHRQFIGVDRISSGAVLVNDKPVKIKHPADAIKIGMGMIPEGRKEQGMFLKLTVKDKMNLHMVLTLAPKRKFIILSTIWQRAAYQLSSYLPSCRKCLRCVTELWSCIMERSKAFFLIKRRIRSKS
jgi:ribose transport system ATP-binding protein